MTDAPKRSDDETAAELVKRRLVDAVRERIDEIEQSAREEPNADGASSDG